ncbi:MAG: dihydropteroate synthase [Friedmanniella sp.]|nr:dihydropteroate synthase [Friedmanniella sp.]
MTTGVGGGAVGHTGPVTYLPPLRQPLRTIGRRRFDFDREIVVMGIVNRTPDSFFDQGATFTLDAAVAAALRAADAGAGWVDVGGVPFSPDTRPVGTQEEVDRVVPVVAAVAGASDVVISVDTFRPEVAAASIAAGASVVNDTTGLRDPELAAVVAGSGATVVITHSLAAPRQPHPRPRYDDVVEDVRRFLESRVQQAVDQGVPESRIVLDAGHDLNKNTLDTLTLTRGLRAVADLGLPMLAAVSNKDFVGESTGLAKPDRLAPSLAAASVCVLEGARILRMHDVAASVAAARMLEAILGLRSPEGLRHNMT